MKRIPSRLRGAARSHRAFTMLEILLAVAIFAMAMVAIFSTWTIIMKSSRSGEAAANTAQRARVAVKCLEDAFLTAQMFSASPQLYAFIADDTADFASVSMVSRLPAAFPGVGRFGEERPVRRITFAVERDAGGTNVLMMRQGPILEAAVKDYEPYSLVLAKDVSMFMIQYWVQKGDRFEWVTEWKTTNQLPKLVAIALGQGKSPNGDPRDFSVTVVAPPSFAVPPDWQMPGAGGPQPGQVLPGVNGLPGGAPTQ